MCIYCLTLSVAMKNRIELTENRTIHIPLFYSRFPTDEELTFQFPEWDLELLREQMLFIHSYTDTQLICSNQPLASFSKPITLLLDKPLDLISMQCDCTSKEVLCSHLQTAIAHLNSPTFYLLYPGHHLETRKKAICELRNIQYSEDISNFFKLELYHHKLELFFDDTRLLNLEKTSVKETLNTIFQFNAPSLKVEKQENEHSNLALVFSEHKYYDKLNIQLISFKKSDANGIKGPLIELDPLEMALKDRPDDVENLTEIVRFFQTISRFSPTISSDLNLEKTFQLLPILFKNPLNFNFYKKKNTTQNLTLNGLIPFEFILPKRQHILLQLNEKGGLITLSASLHVDDHEIPFDRIGVYAKSIFYHEDIHFPICDLGTYNLYVFLKRHANLLHLPKHQFETFKTNYLDQLPPSVQINYGFFQHAPVKELKEIGLELIQQTERKIYLSESEDFICITPVVQYGDREINVLSQQTLAERDENNNWYKIDRNERLENDFIQQIRDLHPYFEEQGYTQPFFYLHRNTFFASGWFIEAFEQWKRQSVAIYGFKQLNKENWSPQKIHIIAQTNGENDWFETKLKLKIGKDDLRLDQLVEAIKKKRNYVLLDDGSKGLLPTEWLERFARYFRLGKVSKDGFTSHISQLVDEDLWLFEYWDDNQKKAVQERRNQLLNQTAPTSFNLPKGLKATLRKYQEDGFHWLCTMDYFQMGAVLADDMGLGKTVQILSFLLYLKENKRKGNLVILPTSLLFNWKDEIQQFAPSLKVYYYYGSNRILTQDDVDNHDVIITSYGSMLSSITELKSLQFHYIILDEAQAIKNPQSLRHKALCQLKAWNRFSLSGTPIENNTFDIYAQFSFLNPLLFGNKQHFQENYSTPIDKFQDVQRSKELHKRIHPFILRRTKSQVVKELPEKTERVIYCELTEHQRKLYDAYKLEIRTKLQSKEPEDKGSKNMLVLSGLTKLRQICNAAQLLSEDVDYGNASSKIEFLMREIEEQSPHHKMVVFSQFVGMLELIEEELKQLGIPYKVLTGQTKDREEVVKGFKLNEEIRVFLVSLKAGGTGLNLTEADLVYLVDPWWNPAVEQQAIDRCYRIGQTKHVFATRLVSPDTVEERILLLKAKKKSLAEDIIRTDLNILKELKKEELLNLFE